MNIRFIKSREKKQIVQKLKEQYGIEELPYLLIATGKEKIRAFSGSLSKDEIIKLSGLINIEIIGLYFLKNENNALRLSFDATHILKDKISKNIVKINEEQLKEWIKGNDLNIQAQKGITIIQHNNDFLGCGSSNAERIANYVPKERRLRK